jgi:segregation and condensation protein A
MTVQPFQPQLDFETADEAAEDGDALIVDIDGYEGPLHALLALARSQKVDLMKLSILRLAEQYLAFVQQARRLRFSLAADYLVMAAWLAYLKSRLLLPKPAGKTSEEPPAEEMAAALAFRLAKLDAMRRAAEALRQAPMLKRDIFVRGDPEQVRILSSGLLEGDLYGLMKAYAEQRRTQSTRRYQPAAPQAYPLEDARDHLRALLPDLTVWRALSRVAPDHAEEVGHQGPSRASYLASTLSAGLELVKEGALEARQAVAFEEVYLRARRRVEVGI